MSSVLKVFQIAFQMLHVKVIHMRQENKEHERVALEYMGHSFVKVPRVLYARVLRKNVSQVAFGFVYFMQLR